MRKGAQACTGVLVSATAVYAILYKLSFAQVAHAACAASKPLLLAGVFGLAVGYTVRCFRWWLMLRAGSNAVSLTTAARILMAGFAANNLLPLRAGDGLRVFGFRRAMGLSSSFLLATLALERILDALSLLVLGLCFIKFGHLNISQHVVNLIEGTTVVAIAALVGPLAFTGVLRRFAFWTTGKLLAQPERRSKFDVSIGSILHLFDTIGPLEAVHLTVLSLVSWSFEALLYICVARALPLHVSVVWACMALLAANVSSIVPSSPGYVGTFHASIIAMLVLAGAQRSAATAYAVVVHGILWIAVTFAGIAAYLLLRRRSLEDAPGVAA